MIDVNNTVVNLARLFEYFAPIVFYYLEKAGLK